MKGFSLLSLINPFIQCVPVDRMPKAILASNCSENVHKSNHFMEALYLGALHAGLHFSLDCVTSAVKFASINVLALYNSPKLFIHACN